MEPVFRHEFYVSCVKQKAGAPAVRPQQLSFQHNSMEFFSMDQSFVKGQLYVFSIYAVGKSNVARIYLEKIKDHTLERFDKNEAEKAFKLNFYGFAEAKIDYRRSEFPLWIEPSIHPTKSVAFCLEDASKERNLQLMLRIAGKEVKGQVEFYDPNTHACQTYVMQTGPVDVRESEGKRYTIYGLMTPYPKMPPLLECSQFLSDVYPKEFIKKISYCPDEVRFRERHGIHRFPCLCENASKTKNEPSKPAAAEANC